MYIANRIPFRMTLPFVRRAVFFFVLYSFVVCMLYAWLGWRFLALPFIPIAIVGVAAAFYVGTKNDNSLERIGEARRIWSNLVNSSRAWGIRVMDYVSNLDTPVCCSPGELYRIQQLLMYRHIAYLNALRLQLRSPLNWHEERGGNADNKERQKSADLIKLDKELSLFLHDEEVDFFIKRQNPAAQIIRQQSKQLQELRRAGLISDVYHSDLERMLTEFYTQQGDAERIKSMPMPGHYATFSYLFVWLFIGMLPFGLLTEMSKASDWYVWLTIPFYTIIAGIFYTMLVMGDTCENPFGNSINDIPMTAICRSIEIDLREMLGETELPQRIQPTDNVLM